MTASRVAGSLRLALPGLLGAALAVIGVVLALQSHSVMTEERDVSFDGVSRADATASPELVRVTARCAPLRLLPDSPGQDGVTRGDEVTTPGDGTQFAVERDRQCDAWRANAAARVGVLSAVAVGLGVLAAIALAVQATLLLRHRRRAG